MCHYRFPDSFLTHLQSFKKSKSSQKCVIKLSYWLYWQFSDTFLTQSIPHVRRWNVSENWQFQKTVRKLSENCQISVRCQTLSEMCLIDTISSSDSYLTHETILYSGAKDRRGSSRANLEIGKRKVAVCYSPPYISGFALLLPASHFQGLLCYSL